MWCCQKDYCALSIWWCETELHNQKWPLHFSTVWYWTFIMDTVFTCSSKPILTVDIFHGDMSVLHLRQRQFRNKMAHNKSVSCICVCLECTPTGQVNMSTDCCWFLHPIVTKVNTGLTSLLKLLTLKQYISDGYIRRKWTYLCLNNRDLAQ